jgi:hypothetical protein
VWRRDPISRKRKKNLGSKIIFEKKILKKIAKSL